MSDLPTRESCNRCYRVRGLGFYSPLWKQVAGRHWEHDPLCVACFAMLGDERGIAWEEGLEFLPVSLVTHLSMREEP